MTTAIKLTRFVDCQDYEDAIWLYDGWEVVGKHKVWQKNTYVYKLERYV